MFYCHKLQEELCHLSSRICALADLELQLSQKSEREFYLITQKVDAHCL